MIKLRLPISLNVILKEFKLQTNLINEANNYVFIKNEYKSNDLMILLKVHKISKNMFVILIEGIKIDDSNSNYKTSNIITIKIIY